MRTPRKKWKSNRRSLRLCPSDPGDQPGTFSAPLFGRRCRPKNCGQGMDGKTDPARILSHCGRKTPAGQPGLYGHIRRQQRDRQRDHPGEGERKLHRYKNSVLPDRSRKSVLSSCDQNRKRQGDVYLEEERRRAKNNKASDPLAHKQRRTMEIQGSRLVPNKPDRLKSEKGQGVSVPGKGIQKGKRNKVLRPLERDKAF